MTRLLHTADVHLRSDTPERLDALHECLALAESAAVDVVTIGGDLFDGPGDAEELRPTLRNELFADRPFPIVLIPGNHDGDAFAGDVFFGNACTVLLDEPFETWTDPTATVRITGLPYRHRADDELLVALADREAFEGTEILLLHCSLEAPLGDVETGDEPATRYFPIARETLADLGFDYTLAGHYHSAHHLPLGDGGEFVYPGTPASTRSSEAGRRQVVILDTDRGEMGFEPLDSFRYERERFTVSPGEAIETCERIAEWHAQHDDANAELAIEVEGYHRMAEEAFATRLHEAAPAAAVIDDTRNVERALNHPLFDAFETALAAREWDAETTEDVWRRTVEVFASLEARGEL